MDKQLQRERENINRSQFLKNSIDTKNEELRIVSTAHQTIAQEN